MLLRLKKEPRTQHYTGLGDETRATIFFKAPLISHYNYTHISNTPTVNGVGTGKGLRW